MISFLATGSDVGLVLLPIATVDPQKTYTVEVIVHATNPVGGRMYQAGLAGWPFGWLTTPGSYGAPIATTTTARRNRLSGERTVYKCASCTQIKWQTRRGTDRGIAGFEIYDSAGISITPDLATYDCYNGSNDFVTSTIASDLAEADY
ncbi:hypothetical protein, partial [Escherichia coli]|uniref:hypothetical protein n=1 Tax=Escherichia coli TaxID=562 RepID=UPI0022F3E306